MNNLILARCLLLSTKFDMSFPFSASLLITFCFFFDITFTRLTFTFMTTLTVTLRITFLVSSQIGSGRSVLWRLSKLVEFDHLLWSKLDALSLVSVEGRGGGSIEIGSFFGALVGPMAFVQADLADVGVLSF